MKNLGDKTMSKGTKFNKHVLKRLAFIDFILLWDGEISRATIYDHFSTSPQQATIDINKYIDEFPNSMFYDPRKKRYVAHPNFEPSLIDGTSKEYLRYLEAYAEGYKSEDEIWIQKKPKVGSVNIPKRDVDTGILKSILEAIEKNLSFEMEYTSLSSDSHVRRIAPHALGSGGNRWHVRAFDFENDQFADFVISRIAAISNFEASTISPTNDLAWDNIVSVRVTPDTNLSDKQRFGVAREYEIQGEILEIETTQAMLFYCLRRLGFNPRPEKKGEKMNIKSSYQLELLNLDEVEVWLDRRKFKPVSKNN